MNVLVITLDTVRADRIGAYGYERADTPAIDGLFRNGVLFAGCYTPVPLTLPAHSSIFTGRTPLGHKVRDNGTFFLGLDEVTLAEEMKGAGYETYAVVASFVLMAKFGLNQGFTTYDDSLNAAELLRTFHSEIPADLVYAKFRRWFSKRGEGKFFAWVHFYDPHAPYEPPESFRRGRDGLSGLYDGEIAYADLHVGRIIQDLEADGILDETLVVIVGDHGEAFGEHREFGHSVFCYDENLRVPLIFSNPRVFPGGTVIDGRVSLIDVMPTLLELSGMKIPPSVQGESLAGLLAGKRAQDGRPVYVESMYGKEAFGWAPLAGIIAGRHKFLSLPQAELYDLAADPGEQVNLFASEPAVARDLDAKLKGLVLRLSASGESSRRKMTSEDRKRLESLGYISAFAGGSGTALDPKSGILLQGLYNSVNDAIERGDLDAADAALADIAAEYPGIKMPDHYELKAKVGEKRKDLAGVVAAWREAVSEFPGNLQFKITLAGKLIQAGKLDEAEVIGREIVTADGGSSRGYILLGDIAERKADFGASLGYFERALGLEPNNASLKAAAARLLEKSNQGEKAYAFIREILADETVTDNPLNSSLLSDIGGILTEMNRTDEALQVLLRASEMASLDGEIWNRLGAVYYRQKEFEKAWEAYDKALDIDPRNASALNNLGILQLRRSIEAKDPALLTQAVDCFNRALELNPRLVTALNGRASALSFSNRIPEAVRDWRRILEIQPEFADAYFNLGIAYLQTGNRKEALRVLRECRERLYDRLPPEERSRLDRLISEAGR